MRYRTKMARGNKKTLNMVFMSLILAISLALHYIESSLPSLVFVVPGLRLGLSNIVLVIMLCKFKPSQAFLIMLLRIVLSSAFGGGPSVFIYSLAGGLFSFLSMLFLIKSKAFDLSLIGISMIGSVFFNAGQLLVASALIDSAIFMAYLPIMAISSIITGLFVGLVSVYVCENRALWKNLNL